MLKEHPAPESLADAIRHFADPDVSLAFVVQLRWPSGVHCPLCNAEKPSFLTTRRIWKCRECRKQFSVKVGTIFEDSPLGLDKWLPALWMLANCKNGVSSYELGRALGVTQKSAWFMLHRIRLAMQVLTIDRMEGEIEVDETFVGGRSINMHKTKRARVIGKGGSSGKAAVVGLLERKRHHKGTSQVRASVIPNVKRRVLDSQVRANVEPGAKVYTDALQSYNELSDEYSTTLLTTRLSMRAGAFTPTGWKTSGRCSSAPIKGTYVSVDPFHLNRYLDEQTFRFNQRGGTDGSRFTDVLRQIVGRRLTYLGPIGKWDAQTC